MDNPFNGEYWNVDSETGEITRFRFTHYAEQTYVAAWGSCFPTDCEWGETELHLLKDKEAASRIRHAFATWDFGSSGQSHCLFTLDRDALNVLCISIRSEIPSYKSTLTFRQDAARSAEAQNADPLARFKHMWDGSQPSWKLAQYRHPVFMVELTFDEAGPSRSAIPAIKEFVDPLPNESDDQMWERLRGCTGIGRAPPLGPAEMNRFRTWEREGNFNLNVCTIEPDDYLAISPEGKTRRLDRIFLLSSSRHRTHARSRCANRVRPTRIATTQKCLRCEVAPTLRFVSITALLCTLPFASSRLGGFATTVVHGSRRVYFESFFSSQRSRANIYRSPSRKDAKSQSLCS